MLKILEKIGRKRRIDIILDQSPGQYPNYKTTTDMTSKDKYKRSVVVFDDKLRARNSSQIDELLKKGRHEEMTLEVYYISQSYFG